MHKGVQHWFREFDVLLSNMRMTEADEGFNLLNAMHNKNPNAVTLVYTGNSELEQALDTLLLQANEVSVKPMALPTLVSLIHEKLEKRGIPKATNIERVAAILERDSSATIRDWLLRVEREDELTSVPLTTEQRTGHLPKLLQEIADEVDSQLKQTIISFTGQVGVDPVRCYARL